MVSSHWYCESLSLRSLLRPAAFELPTLLLSRKATRYVMQMKGTICMSSFRLITETSCSVQNCSGTSSSGPS